MVLTSKEGSGAQSSGLRVVSLRSGGHGHGFVWFGVMWVVLCYVVLCCGVCVCVCVSFTLSVEPFACFSVRPWRKQERPHICHQITSKYSNLTTDVSHLKYNFFLLFSFNVVIFQREFVYFFNHILNLTMVSVIIGETTFKKLKFRILKRSKLLGFNVC